MDRSVECVEARWAGPWSAWSGQTREESVDRSWTEIVRVRAADAHSLGVRPVECAAEVLPHNFSSHRLRHTDPNDHISPY